MRIISLSPSATEILFAVGIGVDIIANTIYCDYPSQAKSIPKIGSWIRIDIEKIKQMKPDILFTSSIVQEKIYQQLKDANLHVCHTDPRSLEGIYESILEISQAVSEITTAKKIVVEMRTEEKRVRRMKHKSRPKLYIEEWFNPPMVSGNWVPDIAELAGFSYGIVKSGELSRAITLEEVAEYDPDIILSSYCGFGKNSNPNHILRRSGWNTLRAVKEKHLYTIDETILNRPGPRILQAAKDIRKATSLRGQSQQDEAIP